MTTKKRLGLSDLQADTLAMTLQESDLLGAVQTAMRVRKIELILDYRTHVPSLSLRMPGVEPELWQVMYTRERRLFRKMPVNPDLRQFVTDMNDRLDKQAARMTLIHHKDHKTQRKFVKMVVISEYSKLIHLSLVGVYKGGACVYDGVKAEAF